MAIADHAFSQMPSGGRAMSGFLRINFLFLIPLLASFLATGFAGAESSGGPHAGAPGIDKPGDAALAELIRTVAPAFRQLDFVAGGKTLKYKLFAPEKMEKGRKYPLVLFMGDASAAGRESAAPLTQGYGALVFASAQSQAENPCYVLAPQFSGLAVNDAWQLSEEAEMVIPLVKEVLAQHAADARRVYVTGQSMGGMLGMHYLADWPDLFAAGLFVDGYWDSASLDRLALKPFVFVYADDKGKARECEQAIEEACRKVGRNYAWAEWSAALPLETQFGLAENLLGKDAPVNLVGFENAKGDGQEHSFNNKAYHLAPLRNWLFGRELK